MTQTLHTSSRLGFTLVELMLAIGFIGFLILFTVLATLQVMRTYDKGLAIKEINQTARTIVDEISRSVRASTTTSINTAPNDASPSQSRICIGGVSYVWNVASGTINKFIDGSTPVTFVRVNDPAGSLCSQASGTYPNVNPANATALLSSRVWVQSFNITKNSTTGIATITIQLSTTDDPTSPTLESVPGGVECKGSSGDQFCAVATLSTAVAMRGNE